MSSIWGVGEVPGPLMLGGGGSGSPNIGWGGSRCPYVCSGGGSRSPNFGGWGRFRDPQPWVGEVPGPAMLGGGGSRSLNVGWGKF